MHSTNLVFPNTLLDLMTGTGLHNQLENVRLCNRWWSQEGERHFCSPIKLWTWDICSHIIALFLTLLNFYADYADESVFDYTLMSHTITIIVSGFGGFVDSALSAVLIKTAGLLNAFVSSGYTHTANILTHIYAKWRVVFPHHSTNKMFSIIKFEEKHCTRYLIWLLGC